MAKLALLKAHARRASSTISLDEAAAIIQKNFRISQFMRMDLWISALKSLDSVTKIQTLVRGKLAKEKTVYKRARRNSGLLKWDIVKARMREIVKRHETQLQRAKRSKQSVERRKQREARIKGGKRKSRNGEEEDAEQADEASDIQDLTNASMTKVRRARMRKGSYSFVLPPTQNSLQAFLSMSPHRVSHRLCMCIN
jgi:hypothetical protein